MAARLVRMILVLCMIPLIGGCAAVRRPAITADELIADGQAARVAHRHTIDHMVETLARRAARRGDRTLDVLYLSGGGQNGAFGAGFLRGWRERTSEPMPLFDLVTGVSAGSIQSPFALVGSEAALDTVGALFDGTIPGAPTFDPWFWFRKTGGVLEDDRFRRTIRRVVDRRLAAQMRASFHEDRQLLIATTDFDLGVGKLWDVGAELEASPAGLTRVQDLIVASSSIPGAFPSVILDRHLHLDGGVMSNLAMPLDLATLEALAGRLKQAGVSEPVTIRLWVIHNLWTHAETSVTNPSSLGSISRRTTLLLFSAKQPLALSGLEALTRAVATEVPGLSLEVHHTAIPSELAEDPAAKALVDDAWMQRLQKLGYERAQSAAPWDVGVPGLYERPEVRPHTEN